jgi:hypothetical protein
VYFLPPGFFTCPISIAPTHLKSQTTLCRVGELCFLLNWLLHYCNFVACTYCAAKVQTEISLTLCSTSFHKMHNIAIALPACEPGVAGGVSGFPHKFDGQVWRSVFPTVVLTTCHGQHPLKRGLKLWRNKWTVNTTLLTSYIHRKMKKKWRSSLIIFSQIWL